MLGEDLRALFLQLWGGFGEHVVEDLGARPVFADVSRETFNMTPKSLEAAVTPATKAVIFVDALGNPSGLTRISEICRAYGLPLIEDAACADNL